MQQYLGTVGLLLDSLKFAIWSLCGILSLATTLGSIYLRLYLRAMRLEQLALVKKLLEEKYVSREVHELELANLRLRLQRE